MGLKDVSVNVLSEWDSCLVFTRIGTSFFFFFLVLFFVCFLVETWVSDMPKNIGRSSIFVLSFKLFFTVLIFMLHIVEDDSSQPVNAL